ncbi:MAG: NADH-quinone oxidoreductase subunit NuoK [Nitrososphaerota archaeon]
MILSYIINNLSIIIFLTALWGIVVVRMNLILMIMCIEMVIFSVSVGLISISAFFDDLFGQMFIIFLLSIAASESALGLAIVVIYYKLRGTLKFTYITTLKT